MSGGTTGPGMPNEEHTDRGPKLSAAQRALLDKRLREARAGGRKAPSIPRRQAEGFAPLSPSQQGLWLVAQLDPDSAAYNVPAAIHINGPLDAAALGRSLNDILRRHEILRTSIVVQGGEPVQYVSDAAELEVPLVDLEHLRSAAREDEVRRHAEEEAQTPFDLMRAPLMRARLLRLSGAEHVLLLTLHHIASDAWGLGVLARELGSLYSARLSGDAPALDPLPVQYADYAAWERGRQRGGALDAGLEYWAGRLGGAPEALGLPADFARPAARSQRGATHPLVVTKELTERLRALCRGEGVTLFMVLLAAFDLLLSRYTGSDDIVVGTPVAGRSRRELESLVGCFVNTLALRADLSGDPTVSELLRRVREATLSDFAHQDVPFERVVERLRPERTLSYDPLVQVMFAFQNAPKSDIELPGLTLRVEETPSLAAKFDLTLSLEERAGGLAGEIKYSTDLFAAATIERMCGHFITLLEGMVEAPGRRVESLPMLTEGEARLLHAEARGEAAEFEQDVCLQELFASQAARTPDAVALVCEGRRLGFGELNRKANQLAHHLRKRGVGPEVRVGLCAERSLEMIVGVLGILKAGGAYVPIDPNDPPSRVALVLEDARSPVLLTQRHLAERLSRLAAEVISLDADWGSISAESTEEPPAEATPDNLAYVIYTSGSTGRPKGVLVQHRSVLNLMCALRRSVYSSLPGRPLRVGLNAPLSFDASVKQLFMLLYGHTLHVFTDRVRYDPAALLSYARQHELDAFDCTPTLLLSLVAAGLLDAEGHKPFAVLVGGEAIGESLWHDLARADGISFYNLYGPTECTVDASACRVSPDLSLPTIGRALANVEVHVLDRHLRPLPHGIPGEIYVGGAGLARGYLARPGLTAERFIPNPFSALPGARLYRTGDTGRRLPGGHVEFLGRLDHQVKVRGYRVETAEVEAALREHAAVAEAVVLARDVSHGDRRLVAYLVPASAEVAGPPADELRRHLRERLPDYMVPSSFVAIESLPLTPSGKVDRRRLSAMQAEESAEHTSSVRPRTPTEELIAGIWQEVLGRGPVGVADNFFELGGHSLSATQVVSRVREACGVEVTLRALFDSPTVEGLAAAVEAELRGGAAGGVGAVSGRGGAGPAPLSFAQQRLWLIEQLEPGNAIYNLPAALRLRGRLDVSALEATLSDLVRRHEILRTTFSAVDGLPVQVVGPGDAFGLPVVDLQGVPGDEREAAVQRLAVEEARLVFDLERGPLMRARLLRLSGAEHVLLLTLHHIASDAWGLGVLARELGSLYSARLSGVAPALDPLPVQYADYAAWERGRQAGGALDAGLEYWAGRLGGAPEALGLPADFARPAARSHRGARHIFYLPEGLAERLKGLCRREDVTPFMLLLAAFNVLLMRYSGQEDIVVGTPVANRTRAELEGLVGCFVNTLALRADLSGDPTVSELLRRVREATLSDFAHQDVPFERLVDELRVARDLSRTPLFQVMFALQNAPREAPELPGLSVEVWEVHPGTAQFDMTWSMSEAAGGLGGAVEYNTDIFKATTVARMCEHFVNLLNGFAEDAGQRVRQLPLMGAEERRRLVFDWNRTGAEYPRESCLHELIEEQAARTPDAVAVESGDGRLTYGELNRRANQLAHHLRAEGVRPETRVGVCLERTCGLAVALLAIFKAGAAYLPLDLSYPRARLSFMIEDAGVRLLLAERKLVPLLPEHSARVLCPDAEGEAIARRETHNPARLTGPQNLAYVLYTSGSTGVPKGVAVEHRQLVNFLEAMRRQLEFSSGDTLLAVTTLSFDIAGLELYLPLLTGARVELLDRETASDADALRARLERESATFMQATPATWRMLVEAGWDGGRKRLTILCGGEALGGELAAALVRRGRRVWNLYGPTETTIWSLATRLEGPEESVTIGRPVANTRVYLLDVQGQPVPVGVAGELYLGGDGLARGYLNRPGTTAERFVPDPFGAEPGARLYRTGDLARYLEDGRVEFLGRADQQVKLRGFRVELGEVEAALSSLPGVREAAVVAREGAGESLRLVGYVVGEGLEAAELRRGLRERLPAHMVPEAFVALDALPLTPNGKVDRRALPDPTPRAEGAGFTPPRTPTEKLLAEIWSQVLGLKQVDVNANFFELGGDSILCVQVAARAARANLHVAARQIFQHPTILELAAAADGRPSPPPAETDWQASPSDFEDFGWGEEDVEEIMSKIEESSGGR